MKDADQQIIATLREIKARIEAGGGGGAAWGAITGTLSAQTDLQAALDALAPPYLVYTALLTQSGTDAPVATVLQNTLGGTVVWTRESTGYYKATLAGAFTANKVAVFTTPDPGANKTTLHFTMFSLSDSTAPDDVAILSYDAGSQLNDTQMLNDAVEIRVYP